MPDVSSAKTSHPMCLRSTIVQKCYHKHFKSREITQYDLWRLQRIELSKTGGVSAVRTL
jgi:hypothetical protein